MSGFARACQPGFSPPSFERDDAIKAAGELEVVGCDQSGEPGAADEIEQRVHHAVAGRMVKIAGRLVGKQDPRVVGQRADDGNTLLFAAREPRRPV